MEQLTHRSCSNCVYWGNFKFKDEEGSGVIKAICERTVNINVMLQMATSGGDKCGQWKKLKWKYDPMFDEMKKDYS